MKALLHGRRLFTLLHFAGFGKSLLKQCGALWPTTGWWHAVFVAPCTNWKPWAVVTCTKLAVKSLKGPLDHHKQKVLPSKICPPFTNTFLKPLDLSLVPIWSVRLTSKHTARGQRLLLQTIRRNVQLILEDFLPGRGEYCGKEPATQKTLMTCCWATADIYQSDTGESVHHMIFFFPAPEHSVYWGAEADVTYWQKKNTLFPVLLAWRCINTVCWDVLFHTRLRDKLLIHGY